VAMGCPNSPIKFAKFRRVMVGVKCDVRDSPKNLTSTLLVWRRTGAGPYGVSTMIDCRSVLSLRNGVS
jgi:hypothetical protein